MMQRAILFAFLLIGAADARAVGRNGDARGHGFLRVKGSMQPEVVAHSLVKVEDEWNAQAEMFAECNATATTSEEMAECQTAPRAFKKACSTVVNAVVAGSSGDRSDVSEYMANICDQEVLKGWRAERCQAFASAVTSGMSDDAYDNRERLDATGLCAKFWMRFSADEVARIAAEKAAKEAQEKKEAEERAAAEKKEAEEHAEAEKKAEEEAAAAAEKKKQEEEAEQAARAAEAQKKADEAAAKMEEQKAQVEQAAADADKKLAEVNTISVAANSTNGTANATNATDAADSAAPADVAAPAVLVSNVTAAANATSNTTVAANLTANTTNVTANKTA